ncbi:hypothetical protein FB451DRAFT_1178374 [Mycena latifolia]|nr:hypothetical protein FB451DRAFT_1178374 [Mycena latifolia]
MSDSQKIDDPDFLAFVARGLDEANDAARRNEADAVTVDPLIRRQADILDSLAYVLVGQETGQVVAVAGQIQQTNDGAKVLLLVAENRPVLPGVIPHIRDIFQRLQRIRAALPPNLKANMGSPRYISDKTGSTFERELLGLEISILAYSEPKLKQRITKNFRVQNFTRAVEDICGPPAQDMEGLDETQKEILARLQSSSKLDMTLLKALAEDIEQLDKTFKTVPSESNTARIPYIRSLLHSLLEQKRALKTEQFKDFNEYTRGILRANGEVVRKDPDAYRWLSKIVSLVEHYLTITTIATSPVLAEKFLQDVQIKSINNPSPLLQDISLSRKVMKETLEVYCDEGGTSADTGIDELLGILAKAHKLTEELDGKFTVENKALVHCECALLAAIHGQTAIPYIGVSKLSCVFCDIYFSAYRKKTDTVISTRGGHSQTTSWKCPSIDEPAVDAGIRQLVATKLGEKIARSWRQYHRASMSSQSTSASGNEARWAGFGNITEQIDADKERLKASLSISD